MKEGQRTYKCAQTLLFFPLHHAPLTIVEVQGLANFFGYSMWGFLFFLFVFLIDWSIDCLHAWLVGWSIEWKFCEEAYHRYPKSKWGIWFIRHIPYVKLMWKSAMPGFWNKCMQDVCEDNGQTLYLDSNTLIKAPWLKIPFHRVKY